MKIMISKTIKIILVLLVFLSLIGLFIGKSISNKKTIKLMDTNWIEQKVQSRLAIRLIESNTDYKVKYYNTNGGAAVAQKALEKGDVNIIPSQTGSVLTMVLKVDPPHDAEKSYVLCKDGLDKMGISIIRLHYQNDYAVLVSKSFSETNNIYTISDLKKIPNLIGGVTVDMYNRDNAVNWKNFIRVYGLSVKHKILDFNLMYTSADRGINFIMGGESNNPLNDKNNLVVLKDDKSYFPAYETIYLYKDLPVEVITELNKLKITGDEMRYLMSEYEKDSSSNFDKIIDGFLKSKGLIK